MADQPKKSTFTSDIFKSITNKLPYQTPNVDDIMGDLNPKYEIFQDTGIKRTEALANQSILYKNDYKNDSVVKKDYNIILNIDTVLDTTDNEHEIIIEIVGHDENKKTISREKYLYYKKNNLDVRHENL